MVLIDFHQRRGQVHAAAMPAGIVSRAPAPAEAQYANRTIRYPRGFGVVEMIHRGSVYIRLERGAGLPPRTHRTVELAFPVVAAANHCAHSTFMVNGNQGCIANAIGASVLAKVGDNRFLGCPLQVKVNGSLGDPGCGSDIRLQPCGLRHRPSP